MRGLGDANPGFGILTIATLIGVPSTRSLAGAPARARDRILKKPKGGRAS